MNSNSTFRQIFNNTLSGWGSVLMRSVVAVVMIPVLLNAMGKDGYGLIGILGVYVSLSSLADLGLRQALGRELSEAVANQNHREFCELSFTALMLYVAIAVCLVGVGFAYAPELVSLLKVPDALCRDAILLIRVYGSVAILISFVTPVFSSGLTAFMRFDLVNNIQIAVSLVANLVLLSLICLMPEQSMYLWVGVMMINSLAICFVTVLQYRKICYPGMLSFFNLNFKRLKPLFELGGYMYLLQVSFAISNQSAPLIISSFFGTAGVAPYQPGGRISELLRPVVLTLTNQLYPLTTKHHTSNAKSEMQGVLMWGTKYTLILGVLVSAGLLLLAEPLCRIWLSESLGEDYKITVRIMQSWAIVDFLTYLTGSQMSVLLGMKKMKFLVWSQVPGAILSIAVAVYVVGHTALGISGVLLGAIAINFIRRPILLWYSARQCGLKVSTYLVKSYAGPVACYLILLVAGGLLTRWNTIDNVFQLFIAASLLGFIWLISSIALVLTVDDRARVFRVFRTKVIKK